MDWWTEQDQIEYWRNAAEQAIAVAERATSLAEREFAIVEVPRGAGALERLEWRLQLLTETLRAAAATGRED